MRIPPDKVEPINMSALAEAHTDLVFIQKIIDLVKAPTLPRKNYRLDISKIIKIAKSE